MTCHVPSKVRLLLPRERYVRFTRSTSGTNKAGALNLPFHFRGRLVQRQRVEVHPPPVVFAVPRPLREGLRALPAFFPRALVRDFVGRELFILFLPIRDFDLFNRGEIHRLHGSRGILFQLLNRFHRVILALQVLAARVRGLRDVLWEVFDVGAEPGAYDGFRGGVICRTGMQHTATRVVLTPRAARALRGNRRRCGAIHAVVHDPGEHAFFHVRDDGSAPGRSDILPTPG
mmetsp:Transcript_3934/g.13143  ORF Transcript_3934/g.13143 Transcript_3934/m.13143 type:complete len:231 (-) Transcript_3934:186-878(-)